MRRIAQILAGLLALPESNIDGLLAGRRALILAPHPDDESLGCGGLIAAACDAGLAPAVVVLTDGAASHPGSKQYPPEKLGPLREQEARDATRILGLPADNLHFLRVPDSRLPSRGPEFAGLVRRLSAIGQAQGCGMVFAPWAGDPHCDHQAAAGMATALAALHGWALASYPIWGWLRAGTEAFDEPRCGGCKLEITQYVTRKRAAIAAHESQYGERIADSADGFKLPAELLAACTRNFEIFIQ